MKATAKLLILAAASVAIADPTPKPIGLAWFPNPASENVTNYVVYYNTDKSEAPIVWTKLADVSPTSLTNINGTNWVIYYFKPSDPNGAWARFTATAQGGGKESDYCPPVTLRPDPPGQLKTIP